MYPVLDMQEAASLKVSHVVLGFISNIQNIDFFQQFVLFKDLVSATDENLVNGTFLNRFNREVD